VLTKVNNVTPITKNAGRRQSTIDIGALANELRAELMKPEVLNASPVVADNERMLDELDALSSEHMVKRLELAHKREQFNRAEAEALSELNAELEHAAYFAFMAGVPEEDIYRVDNNTAEALSSAISKVQATA
jgi:hypothetical protein